MLHSPWTFAAFVIKTREILAHNLAGYRRNKSPRMEEWRSMAYVFDIKSNFIYYHCPLEKTLSNLNARNGRNRFGFCKETRILFLRTIRNIPPLQTGWWRLRRQRNTKHYPPMPLSLRAGFKTQKCQRIYYRHLKNGEHWDTGRRQRVRRPLAFFKLPKAVDVAVVMTTTTRTRLLALLARVHALLAIRHTGRMCSNVGGGQETRHGDDPIVEANCVWLRRWWGRRSLAAIWGGDESPLGVRRIGRRWVTEHV